MTSHLLNPSRLLLFIMAGLIFILGICLVWEFTIDDAFISFRYARNLADSGTLEYNPGTGNPVEGYSNFLWVAIHAVIIKLGMNPETSTKYLGTASLLLIALSLYLFPLVANYRIKIIMALTLLFIPAGYFHAVSGLETAFYALLLFLSFSLLMLAVIKEKPAAPVLPMVNLILALTRPEGVLIGLLSFAVLWRSGKTAADKKRTTLWFTLLYFTPCLIYFIWRWSYFGTFFPNTFYVKVGYPGAGLVWALESLTLISPFIILLISRHFILGHNDYSRKPIMLGVLFIATSLFIYPFSAPMMDYLERFLFPAIPLFIALAGITVEAMIKRRPSLSGGESRAIAVLFIILIFPMACQSDDYAYFTFYGQNLKSGPAALGKTLAQLDIPSEYCKVALVHAGAIPYYSGWETIDLVGLNDEIIAARDRDLADYLADRRPGLFILYSEKGTFEDCRGLPFNEEQVSRWKLNHTPLGKIAWSKEYFLIVYVESGLPQEIRNKISEGIGKVETLSRTRIFPEPGLSSALKYYRERLNSLLK